MKVSICIPTYQSPATLKRLLDSIKIQTCTDYEIIVSDDTPGNEIEKLVGQYTDLPLVYYKNPHSLGSPENWNQAIRLATGEYIKIMHHDDWFTSSTSIADYVDLMKQNPKAVFGFARHLTTFELDCLHKNPDILGLGNLIGAPSVTIFKNHTDLFFDRQLIWLVDIEFYIRILRKYPDFAYTSKNLVTIGSSDNRISDRIKDNKALIQKEQIYLEDKLDLQYNHFYFVYNYLRHKFILQVKRKIQSIWKQLFFPAV
ncbi:MAG: glycosyltransferase family 2 protein [Candidatus Symbiothrix sp.]|jgi:glycosyltransferase involved in cell wall biosynthesis|nr:glycosyltransferase family 2 protein [Candidatus Symbiothrix sp.]